MTKPQLLNKIGDNIRRIRKAKGLTQTELATICLKDKQSIERVENGKTNPTIFYLNEIAQALNVDLTELTAIK